MLDFHDPGLGGEDPPGDLRFHRRLVRTGFGDHRALFHVILRPHDDIETAGDEVRVLPEFLLDDVDLLAIPGTRDFHQAGDVAERRRRARRPRFEELLHAGEPLRDVRPFRDPSHVEGTHGELRPRLADGLRRDETDGRSELDGLVVAEIPPVALHADAPARLTPHDGTDGHLPDAALVDRIHDAPADFLPPFPDHRPLPRPPPPPQPPAPHATH